MKTKYRQRIILIILSIVMLITTTQALADDATVGQQSISSKGTYYKVKDNGNGTVDVYVDGKGWSRNQDANKPINIEIRHNIPLPKGTTESKLSFKDSDIKNFGKEGDQFNNGHTNIKNGQDLLNSAGGASAPPK